MDEGESTEGVLFSGAFLLFTLAYRRYSTVWPVDKYSLQLIHCTEGKVDWLVSCWISKLHPFILLCRRKTKIPDEAPQAPCPFSGERGRALSLSGHSTLAGCPERLWWGAPWGPRIQMWALDPASVNFLCPQFPGP